MAIRTESLLSGGSIFSGDTGGKMVANQSAKVPAVDDADVRDSIAVLVGGGYRGLNDDQSQQHYQRLAGILGLKKAQDLVSHIIIQNSRPDFQKMKPEERLSRFYDVNSSTPDTNEVLQKMKAFGTGVIPGYVNSSNLVAQRQLGTSGEGIVGKIADYTTKK